MPTFHLDFFWDSGFANSAPMRIVNGPSCWKGWLKVFWKQQWGTVCGDSWDLSDVNCRQTLSAPGWAHFAQGKELYMAGWCELHWYRIWPFCCRNRHWGENNYNHGGDKGLVCSNNWRLQPSPCKPNRLWCEAEEFRPLSKMLIVCKIHIFCIIRKIIFINVQPVLDSSH